MRRLLWGAAALWLMPGCSAILDGDDFPGIRRAPTVHIEPETPKTTDDLRVVLDQPSIDGQGRPITTYRYQWTRSVHGTDGGPAEGSMDGGLGGNSPDAAVPSTSVNDSTLPHGLTHKGERWTVEVIPVVGDRAGPPSTVASASVEIVNTPPVIATVGLSNYYPTVGESIQAFADGVDDADGDAPFIRFEWRVDGNALQQEADKITLNPETKGKELEVSVIIGDGETETERSVGPVPIAPRRTWRWHRIHPDTQSQTIGMRPWMVHDADNKRVLFTDGNGYLWEFRLSEPRQWIPLFPRNAEVLEGSMVALAVADPDRNRIVLISIGPDNTLDQAFALDTTRGKEAFRELKTTGKVPVALAGPAIALDRRHDRVLLFGGLAITDVALSTSASLYAAEFVGDNGLRWSEIDYHGAVPAPVLGASLTVDEERNRAILIGGSSGGNDSGVHPVHMLDLSTHKFTAHHVAGQPPLVDSVMTIDTKRRELVAIYSGGASSGALYPHRYVLQLDGNLRWSRLPETTISPTVGGNLVFLPEEDRFLHLGRQSQIQGSLPVTENRIALVDRDGATEILDGIEHTRPPGLAGAATYVEEQWNFSFLSPALIPLRVLLIGGATYRNRTENQSWTIGTRDRRFSQGTVPNVDVPGGIQSLLPVSQPGGFPTLVGGRGDRLDSRVFSFTSRTAEGAWEEVQGEAEGEEQQLPRPRVGHSAATFRPGFGAAGPLRALIAGGGSGYSSFTDAWILECTAFVGCQWREILAGIPGGTPPETTGRDLHPAPHPGVHGAAVHSVTEGGFLYFFGGNSEELNKVWFLPEASGAAWKNARWVELVPSAGERPAATQRHTVAVDTSPNPADPGAPPDRFFVFGGVQVDGEGDPFTTNELWMFEKTGDESGRWTRPDPDIDVFGAPSPRANATVVWLDELPDLQSGGARLVVFGGVPSFAEQLLFARAANDLWELWYTP
ncbi:MAG: hypothetical protein KC416_01090 [Myxococcales bacterium]|nr:hypothetical protein [Myxococcales bacterium]